MSYDVTVQPKDWEFDDALSFESVDDVTLIDSNTHGQAALGAIERMPNGTRRLLVCSPNIVAALIEKREDA